MDEYEKSEDLEKCGGCNVELWGGEGVWVGGKEGRE